jgi:hypothetical protein
VRLSRSWFSVLVGLPVAALSSLASAQLTPEQRAGAGGQIPNPSTLEYYLGTVAQGSSIEGIFVPRVAGNKANIAWYKFTSDGQTGVVFDMFGSAFGFGGGMVLGGGNTSELAVYTSTGQLVATTEGVRSQAMGESNVTPLIPPGTTPGPLGAAAYRQPRDPRTPAVRWRQDADFTGWSGSNANSLSQLAFVKNAQPNPVWNPSHPQYSPNADWDEYPVLPAGTYFLAVAGFATYFSGYPRDNANINSFGGDYPFASGNVTPTTPFGFVTFSPHSGIYKLQTRLPGDLTLDGSVNAADRNLLKAKILALAPTKGIADAGFVDGTPTSNQWQGLPADLSDPSAELQRFDLTGNSRIDIYDLFQFARWTELPAPLIGDANLDDAVNFDDLLILAANYNRSDDRAWTDGDFTFDRTVNFDDLLGLAANYNTSLPGAWAAAQAFVPEPASIAAWAVAAVSLLTRRGRRCRRGVSSTR